MCYYFYKWSDMNSWWTIKQIKASHRLTFTYLEHHEDLGVRSCKDPELPINALGTALINLVNLLKICSNHQWHQKNVVVLVLRKKKKDMCLNMDCFRITCVRDFLSIISEAADMSGNYLWRSELSDQSLLITNFSSHQNEHLPWLALSRHSDEK